jgi:hypothetical protein
MTNRQDNEPSQPFNPPERLFHYFRPKYSSILTSPILWFSDPSTFNDVFDSCPRYDELIREQNDEITRRIYAFHTHRDDPISLHEWRRLHKGKTDEIIEALNEASPGAFQRKFGVYYGVVCFTEHVDNLLMWGHYTDCHKGFALEYDPRYTLFRPPDFGKVTYSKERPILTTRTRTKVFFCKSDEWRYEDEYRLVKWKDSWTEKRSVPLPMDSIKAVYFGARMSPENRSELLTSLEGHPHVQKYFMRPSRITWKLEAVPWDQWKEPGDSAGTILGLIWPTKPD